MADPIDASNIDPNAPKPGQTPQPDDWRTKLRKLRTELLEDWEQYVGAIVAFVFVCAIIWILSQILGGKTAITLMQVKNRFGVSDAAFFASLWAAFGCCALMVLSLVVAASRSGDRLVELGILLILTMSGAALGGLLGTYLSPQNASEKDAFGGYKTALVGVLSGYLLSKFQKLFDKVVDDDKIFNMSLLIRTLFFVTALGLVTNGVYSAREYKNQRVIISTARETKSSIGFLPDFTFDQGFPISLNPGEQTRFVAEANFPGDSSVTWSIDEIAPIKDPANKDKTVPAVTATVGPDGSFTAPKIDNPCSPCFVIVATSNQDKEKVARRQVNIGELKQTDAKSVTPTPENKKTVPRVVPPKPAAAK